MQAFLFVASFFNVKARCWVKGRRCWRNTLQQKLPLKDENRPRAWFHCASLGEFEQGRPVIEALHAQGYQIVLSFFSPSGYEIRKNYPLADFVCYLPADTPRNARDFLSLVQPDVIVFVKYEFWYHFLKYGAQKAPLILISALFRPNQPFFKQYGFFHRAMLACFTHFFVQDVPSAALLREKAGISPQRITVAGDTRADRVLAIAEKATSFPAVESFIQKQPTLVAGSTWLADEICLQTLCSHPAFDGWKLLLAPHEIHETHLQQIEKRFEGSIIRYSNWLKQDTPLSKQEYSVLLIDNIGMLSSLYQYGRIAWVGGAFGSGLHNVLEPAAFSLPVLFGSSYHRFREAVELVNTNAAFPCPDATALIDRFQALLLQDNWAASSKAAQAYLQENRGATHKIVGYIDAGI